MKYDEVLILVERMTKEQQEAGQREMEKIKTHPILKLKAYLKEKWRKPGIKDMKQKRLEYEKFKFLLHICWQARKLVDEETKEILQKEIKQLPVWFSYSSDNEDGNFYFGYSSFKDELPHLMLNKDILKNGTDNANGLLFKKPEEIKSIINKFIIYHEYGHMYDFMKSYIDGTKWTPSGMNKSIPYKTALKRDESKANHYALDNMYRKDRRRLLDDVKKAPIKYDELGNNLTDIYYNGIKKNKVYKK